MDQHWLTPRDIAAEFGVSTDTVLRLIHERHLRAQVLKVQGRRTFRVRAADWAAFRARHVFDAQRDDWE
jgi:excisionase family DNA binding protein